jgi:hypothetical protein
VIERHIAVEVVMPKPDFRGNIVLKIKDGETQPGWTRAEVWMDDTLHAIVETPEFEKTFELGWRVIPCTRHTLEKALASSIRSMKGILDIEG